MTPANLGNGGSQGQDCFSYEVDDLIERLSARKITISLDGSKLRLTAPKGAVDATLKEALTARRDEIVEALRRREERARMTAAHDSPIPRPDRNRPLPLSFAQRRLWFLDRLNPGGSAYTIGGASRILGAFDLDLLGRAVDLLVERHEALRMRFREADGTPFAEVSPDVRPTLEVIDASGTPPDERDATATRLIGELMAEPFDLTEGPLFKVTAIRFDDDDHALLNRTHHIIADGWSLALAGRDCCLFYNALRAGTTPALPPIDAQCADHAAFEHRAAECGLWDEDLGFWRDTLAGAPAITELPGDRPRPAQPSFRGGRVTRDIDADLTARLRALATAHGSTVFMVLVAALQILLHRHSGQDDVVIGTPVANRDRAEFEHTIGCLINNISLRGDCSGDPSFATCLDRVRKATLRALEHSAPPFDLVVDATAPERSVSHSPIFQTLFSYMAFPESDVSPAGTRTVPMPVHTGATRFDLAVEMAEFRGVIRTTYEYSSDLYDEETLERTHGRLESLLSAACDDAEVPISRLQMRSPEDRAEPDVAAGPDPARPAGPDSVSMIDAVAARSPARPAVEAGGTTTDYGGLVARANGIARHLAAAGVGPGDRVAVALDRDVDLPAAMLAAWKAGAAYVPIDPTHPPERLDLILSDSQPRVLVTVSSLRARLSEAWTGDMVVLDEAAIAPADAPPRAAPAPDDIAYVIYTSGSTGKPKGVEVTHANLASFLEAMRMSPGFGADDVLVAVTTPSFDIAGLEIWLPLTTGGRVVIASRAAALDGRALGALIDETGATVMQATPAVWRLLIDGGWVGSTRLKALCGGEQMPASLPGALLPRIGSLWNMYGPTETTIWSTAMRIEHPDAPITIGHPIAGTRTYVLDAADRPAPRGVVGELCIAGPGVARGYRNRPELTAEKFATLEIPGFGRERLYRTGDRARRLGDGSLVFCGRDDHQVKLRGYRIELGEIEAALARAPGVAEAVAAVAEGGTGGPILAAYVVASDEAGFSEAAIRGSLRTALPEYMVPTRILRLDALPRTPNLKVDRRALPDPAPPAPEVEADDSVLMSPSERKVARIWCDVLSIPSVGLHDSFFDVGGHSILLLRLHERLRGALGEAIGLVELFQRTTVAQQAEAYDGAGASAGSAALARARRRAEMRAGSVSADE